MKIGVVAPLIPRRTWLQGEVVDAEWVGALANDHTVEVAVDHDGDGCQMLREAGLKVTVSEKRSVVDRDGRRLSAEALLASTLATSHRQAPFDLLVYSSEWMGDVSWYEPSLREVPRAATIPSRPVLDASLVLESSALTREAGRALWAVGGFLANADLLLGTTSPASFGLRPDHLPPVRALGPAPTLRPPAGDPTMVGIVVLGGDRVRYAQVVRSAVDKFGIADHRTFVVVAPSIDTGGDETREVVLSALPSTLATATVFVEPGEDEAAWSLLRSCDALVVGGPAELSVPGVADLAAKIPTVTVEPVAEELPIIDLSGRPVAVPEGERMLMPVDAELGTVGGVLEELESSDVDWLVFYTTAEAGEATRLLDVPRLPGVDLVVLGAPDPVTGAVRPEVVKAGVLAAHRRTWPALRRRLDRVGSLWELIVWTLSLSNMGKVRLLTLAASTSRGCRELPTMEVVGIPAWTVDNGVFDRPNLAEARPGDSTPTPGPPRASVREWAKANRWSNRVRMALPWKFGLLPRAMRGRW